MHEQVQRNPAKQENWGAKHIVQCMNSAMNSALPHAPTTSVSMLCPGEPVNPLRSMGSTFKNSISVFHFARSLVRSCQKVRVGQASKDHELADKAGHQESS